MSDGISWTWLSTGYIDRVSEGEIRPMKATCVRVVNQRAPSGPATRVYGEELVTGRVQTVSESLVGFSPTIEFPSSLVAQTIPFHRATPHIDVWKENAGPAWPDASGQAYSTNDPFIGKKCATPARACSPNQTDPSGATATALGNLPGEGRVHSVIAVMLVGANVLLT